MARKSINSEENFENEYRDLINEIGNLDLYKDIEFPSLEMMEQTRKRLEAEIEDNNPALIKPKKKLKLGILVAGILLIVLIGELGVLRTYLSHRTDVDKGIALKGQVVKDDSIEPFKESDISIYSDAVNQFADKQGYKLVKSSIINMNIRLPKSFDEKIDKITIGKTIQESNERSKGYGYDFSKYMGKRVVLYAGNIKKDGKNNGLLITLIYNNKIVGAWISEKDDIENIIKTIDADGEYKPVTPEKATVAAKSFISKYYDSKEEVKSIKTFDNDLSYKKPFYELEFEHYMIWVDAQSGKVIMANVLKYLEKDNSLKKLSKNELKEKAEEYYKELGFSEEFVDNTGGENSDGSIYRDFSQSIEINGEKLYNPYNSVRIVVSSTGELRQLVTFYFPLIYNGKQSTTAFSKSKIQEMIQGTPNNGLSENQVPTLSIVIPNDSPNFNQYDGKDINVVHSENYSKVAWVVNRYDKDKRIDYIDTETGNILGGDQIK